MVPSGDDMLLESRGREFHVRLANAGKVDIHPYDTGFKTGVMIVLERFRDSGPFDNGVELDLSLYLTVCLEGNDEDLVFVAAAQEGDNTARELDWPKALDARDVDYTVLSNNPGTLLPRNWPETYSPFHPAPSELKARPHPLM